MLGNPSELGTAVGGTHVHHQCRTFGLHVALDKDIRVCQLLSELAVREHLANDGIVPAILRVQVINLRQPDIQGSAVVTEIVVDSLPEAHTAHDLECLLHDRPVIHAAVQKILMSAVFQILGAGVQMD